MKDIDTCTELNSRHHDIAFLFKASFNTNHIMLTFVSKSRYYINIYVHILFYKYIVSIHIKCLISETKVHILFVTLTLRHLLTFLSVIVLSERKRLALTEHSHFTFA